MRKITSIFDKHRTGLVSFADFERGVEILGLPLCQVSGCRDAASAFRVFDRLGRGAILVSQLTKSPAQGAGQPSGVRNSRMPHVDFERASDSDDVTQSVSSGGSTRSKCSHEVSGFVHQSRTPQATKRDGSRSPGTSPGGSSPGVPRGQHRIRSAPTDVASSLTWSHGLDSAETRGAARLQRARSVGESPSRTSTVRRNATVSEGDGLPTDVHHSPGRRTTKARAEDDEGQCSCKRVDVLRRSEKVYCREELARAECQRSEKRTEELERECNAQWCRVRELEHTVHALTNEWNEKTDATEAVQVLQEQLREEVAESRSELDQERQTRSVMLTSIHEGILELSSAADDRALHARQELRAEQDRIQYHESHAVYARQTLDHERLEFMAELAEDEVEIQSLLASTKLHTLEASESHAERSQRIREDAAHMRVDFMEDRAKTAREKRCLQEELHEMEQERRVVSNARNALAMAGPGGAPQSTELQFSLVLRQLEHMQGVVREGTFCKHIQLERLRRATLAARRSAAADQECADECARESRAMRELLTAEFAEERKRQREDIRLEEERWRTALQHTAALLEEERLLEALLAQQAEAAPTNVHVYSSSVVRRTDSRPIDVELEPDAQGLFPGSLLEPGTSSSSTASTSPPSVDASPQDASVVLQSNVEGEVVSFDAGTVIVDLTVHDSANQDIQCPGVLFRETLT